MTRQKMSQLSCMGSMLTSPPCQHFTTLKTALPARAWRSIWPTFAAAIRIGMRGPFRPLARLRRNCWYSVWGPGKKVPIAPVAR